MALVCAGGQIEVKVRLIAGSPARQTSETPTLAFLFHQDFERRVSSLNSVSGH